MSKFPKDWIKYKFDLLKDPEDRYSITGGPFGSDLMNKDYQETGVRVVQLQNIGDGTFIDVSKVYTSFEKADTLKNCNIYPGDIILSKMGDPVARACIIPNTKSRYLMCSDGIRLSVDKSKFDTNYTYYFINSNFFREEAELVSTGTTRKRIGLTSLKEINFFAPSLNEQKKIAEILTSVDKVIELTEIEIEKLKNLKKGMMQDLLTKGIGHTKFKDSPIGKIPESWEAIELKHICEIKHGYAFEGEYFKNEPQEHILLTPGNFHVDGHLYFGTNTKYYEGPVPKDYILENGDLLCVMTDLTKDMAILGNAIILKNARKVLHNQRIGKILINFDRISKEYLTLQLNFEFVKKVVKDTATGTTVRHTSPSKILSCYIPVPSDPKEQELIVESIESVQRNIELKWEKLSKLLEIKKGLMQDLLTGKVRVKV